MREFVKGEQYRPRVKILKVRRGTPTVLMVSGIRYVLDDRDYSRRGKRGKDVPRNE